MQGMHKEARMTFGPDARPPDNRLRGEEPSTSADFELSLQVRSRYLRIAMAGFWSKELMDDYERQMASAMRRYAGSGAGLGSLAVLVLLDGGVQHADIAARLRDVGTRYTPLARKIALVPASPLRRQQLRRLLQSETRKVFSTEAEAARWLVE